MLFSQAGKLRQTKSKAHPDFAFPLVLALVFSLAQAPVAMAGLFPGTGAPLAAARQMAPDKGDPTNPFSYPLLRDIAKSLVRNGFPAAFFFSLEKSAGPGIDLRTILLYEAGVLKSPVKLFMVPRKKKSDIPTLSANSIPESSGEMPSVAPKLDRPGSLEPDAGNGAEAGSPLSRQSAKTEETRDNPALSLDLNQFDLTDSRNRSELASRLTPELGSLSMIQPSTGEAQPADQEESAFRFWTVPPSISPLETRLSSQSSYEGSFVMMSPRGLTAVRGRLFFLTGGHTLVCSRGKTLSVDTPVARVSVEDGATAYVEIAKPGLTRVRVLESRPGLPRVSVKYNSGGKACEIKLSSGDDFLVAEQALSAADKSVQGKAGSGTADGGDNWVKGSFVPGDMIESDKFFSDDSLHQNPEQRSAMSSLRQRLK